MRKLYQFKFNMFQDWEIEVFQKDCKAKKEVKVFYSEKDATEARDTLNIELLLDAATTFLCNPKNSPNYLFKGQALEHAKVAHKALHNFVTGTNTLKKKAKAFAPSIWVLVEEFCIHTIDHLNHGRLPYKTEFEQLAAFVKEFYTMYSEPLFINTPTPKEYENSPAMREFYAR